VEDEAGDVMTEREAGQVVETRVDAGVDAAESLKLVNERVTLGSAGEVTENESLLP